MAADSLVLELGTKLESMKKRAAIVKEKAEKVTGRGVLALSGAAGAAVAGVMAAELGDEPKLPGTEVEADLAIGGVLVALGTIGIAGDKWSDELVAFGTGMMAPAIARGTKAMMQKP